MERPPDDDIRLAREFRDGDSNARSRIVEFYGRRMRRRAASFGLRATDIDDAVQEAWAHVFGMVAKIDAGRGLLGLLITTLDNVCRSMRRSETRLARIDLDRYRAARPRGVPDSRFTQEFISAALRRLTVAQRSTVDLVLTYHVSISGAARLKAVSESAVRVQLSRTRSRLRDGGDEDR